MPKMPLPAEGGCRCDRLRFRITAPALCTGACHCRGCQRMTGGAYSITVTVPASGFAVTAGEPVVGGCRAAEVAHWHCDWCKSWVYTTPAAMPEIVNVRASMLDQVGWFSPFVETQAAEKLAFAETGAPHAFARFPADDEWPRLIKAYVDS